MSSCNLFYIKNPLSLILLDILGIDQEVENKPILPDSANSGSENYNPHSEELKQFVKECIERKIYISGRFRDIYLNEDGTKIILRTRNGGGNRESYWYVFEILRSHPNYLNDYDDEFDNTYAYIEFSVPKEAEGLCNILAKREELEKDEKFKPIIDIIKQLFEQ
jgi:hypothetical protein